MNKEISVSKVIITIILLASIEAFLIIFFNHSEKQNMCEIASCNADKTVCSAFLADEDGKITKIWHGSCK